MPTEVAKAEQIPGKENPRYVVTSLPLAAWPTRELYEQLYCARGEMGRIQTGCPIEKPIPNTETKKK
jgi:hypothetical protein